MAEIDRTPMTSRKRGRPPAGQERFSWPNYKDAPQPSIPPWSRKNKGCGPWLSAPKVFGALLVKNQDPLQLRFLWLIMDEQFIPVEDAPSKNWTEPAANKAWAKRLGCSVSHFIRIRDDAYERGLIEAAKDGIGFRYCARVEAWGTAKAPPVNLHRPENNSHGGNYSDAAPKPESNSHGGNFRRLASGLAMRIPFPVRRVSNEGARPISLKAAGSTLQISDGLHSDRPRDELDKLFAPFEAKFGTANSVELKALKAAVRSRLLTRRVQKQFVEGWSGSGWPGPEDVERTRLRA
jgi:hypothetical protein